MPTENQSSNEQKMVSVPRQHELKIRQTPLADLLSGLKTGEIRDCSDREFAVGDTVLLREIDDGREYTGTVARRTITHVQKHYGLPDHLCVLSYGQPAEQHQGEPIMLTAVAELVDDGDGGLEPLWILEGGTAELFAGMTLLIADNAPDLCQEDGSAEVYAHADSGEVEQLRSERDQLQADLTQRDERVDTLEAMLLKIATNLGGTLEQYGLLKEVAALVRIKDAAAQESAEPDHTPTITIPPGLGNYDGSDNGVD
ncbi:hypothetical protein PF66_04415 [Pseudomonas asplenii]|uniref:DUF3850 domain-containing protein n=2 Tax=Pseudomonas asplenii TaxID=53407 RepID=A0A0M9GE41_9PSED|nr:hypothetical protein PF66_04415 [Pseudomonas fuscovaginae]